jgi:sorbitol-specific phosphotransferase system component IIA
MGHCTLVFTGANEVALPGQIALGGGKAPIVRAGEDLMVVFA